MKLSTYKLLNSNKELIGILKNNSLINLNKYFGEISLIDLMKKDNWKSEILSKIGSLRIPPS